MIKITVEYRDRSSGSTLGVEQFDDIEQVLVPRLPGVNAKVFCIRHFAGHLSERWKVESVRCVSNAGVTPVVVVVELSQIAEHLEYLDQTLVQQKGTIFNLIKPGALVEVDYGFVQDRVNMNGHIGVEHRFLDTHLKGEMHKRRLAIVTKVYDRGLQVAPVTSQASKGNDPTRMRLEPNTLKKLWFYGKSGLNSWALGGALECVSFSRILPPAEVHVRGGFESSSRNTSYRLFISSAEKTALKEAVLRGVGVDDYGVLKNDLNTAQQHAHSLREDIAAKDVEVQELKAELERLRLVERVARDWEKSRTGPSLENEIQFLRDWENDPTLRDI